MAKGQIKGNREAKKPKQTKKLAAPLTGAGFSAPKTVVNGGTSGKNK